MFELHINDKDVTSGAIPITWCLDKETLESIKHLKDPQVVICVAPQGQKYASIREQRYVVSLKDMMTYISFRYPGKNRIYGFLVNNDVMSANTLKERVFQKIGFGCMGYDILNHDGTDYSSSVKGIDAGMPSFPTAEPITVDVPNECFASEPPAWEKTWTLWLLENKGIDQCDYRKRRLFAYTIQPIIMFFNLLARFFDLFIATMLGSRGWSLKYLLHPIQIDLKEANDRIWKGGIIFIRDEPKRWATRDVSGFFDGLYYLIARGWALPFMPAVACAMGLITWKHWWLIFGGSVVLMLLAVGFVALIMDNIIAGVIIWLAKLFMKAIDAIFGAQPPTEEEIETILICTGEPNRPLPKHRTIRLRYMNVKSKVCKPFAQ